MRSRKLACLSQLSQKTKHEKVTKKNNNKQIRWTSSISVRTPLTATTVAATAINVEVNINGLNFRFELSRTQLASDVSLPSSNFRCLTLVRGVGIRSWLHTELNVECCNLNVNVIVSGRLQYSYYELVGMGEAAGPIVVIAEHDLFFFSVLLSSFWFLDLIESKVKQSD